MSFIKIFFAFILLSISLNAFNLDNYLKEKEKNVQEISTFELKNKIFNNDNFYLIDVRLPNETRMFGSIEYKNVLNIPRGMIEFKMDSNIKDKNKEIIVFCQKGSRGILVANTLKEMGYTNVKNLKGGFDEWESTCGDVSKNNNLWLNLTPPKLKTGCSDN